MAWSQGARVGWTAALGALAAAACGQDEHGRIGITGARAAGRAAGAQAAVFYVSPRGKDRWSGRWAEPRRNDGPFATIARARDAVRALRKAQEEPRPVRVILRGGTYYLDQPLEFGPEDSGTGNAPVFYAAAPGERVVLSGGWRLTGGRWGEVNGHKAWVVDIPAVKEGKWRFRQLFVNGERRPRPRLPKTGMYRIEALPGFDFSRQWEIFLDGTKQFVYAGTDIQPWRNLHDVEVIGVTRWITNRLPIQEVDVERRLVTFDRPSLFSLDDTAPPRPSVYWVENVLEALDTPGEWYLDRPQGRLYYLPRPGEDMKKVDLVAPRLTQVLRLAGREGAPVEHVHLEGITFSHNEWEPPAGWASSLQAAIDVPGAVFFDHAGQCSLRRCIIEHVGTYGIDVALGCTDIEITHNRMVDLGAGGVKVGHFYDVERNERGERRKATLPQGPHSRRVTVADNEITGGGQLFPGSVGVFVGENPDNKVVYNHIHHLPWMGISVGSLQTFEPGQATNNVIEHNHVHHIGQGLMSDVGGIYTNSVSPGTRIRGNVVHDIRHRDYGGWGIYTDQGTTDVLVEKNLVYRCSSGPLFVSFCRNITVQNNIFAFGEQYQIFRALRMDWLQYTFRRNIVYYDRGRAVDYWDPLSRQFTYDHNLYWNALGEPLSFSGKSFEEWRAAGHDGHSLVADPLFVGPANGDFRLQPGSPADRIGFEPWDLSGVGPRPLAAAKGTVQRRAQMSERVKRTPKLQRLKVGPNGRFLVTEDGKPFFWLGDTAWCLRKLSHEEIDLYMAHRVRHGFNVILVYCGYNLNTWISAADRSRNRPFLQDNTDTPNEAFWQNMDAIVRQAGEHGLYIALVPMWGGEFKDAFGADAPKANRLGRWLGARYKDRSHVLWVASGEYTAINNYAVPITAEQKGLFLAFGRGLHDGHGGTQLTTIHPGATYSSAVDFHGEAWLDLNLLQSGHHIDREAYDGREVYSLVAHDYALTPAKPVLDGEPVYEDIIDGVFARRDMTRPRAEADVMRRKAFWSVLAGACGHTYGHNDIEVFQEDTTRPIEGSQRHHWKDVLDAPGALQMKHVRALMEALPFRKGVPDQSVLASDPGKGKSHVQANRAADGSYALAYLPAGGTVTVQMEKVAGRRAKCAWFDPRTGHTTSIGEFPSQGERTFTAPGEPGPGNDWVLVLRSASTTR